MGLTKQEDEWICSECNKLNGRHDMYFDGACELCNTDANSNKLEWDKIFKDTDFLNLTDGEMLDYLVENFNAPTRR